MAKGMSSEAVGEGALEARLAELARGEGPETRSWTPAARELHAERDHDGWTPGTDACDVLAGRNSGLGPAGWRRADAALRDKILERLFEDRILNARGVEVHVEEGVVTLAGGVAHASDVRLAEILTREICPLAEIRNRLHGPAGR